MRPGLQVDLRRRFSVSLKGATLAQITSHADAMRWDFLPLEILLSNRVRMFPPKGRGSYKMFSSDTWTSCRRLPPSSAGPRRTVKV